ncbi:clustered mitochondria protein homolog [Acropora millepora]|uniref:clustered mitochondria protein homolog n=1 Tax=Acropora millepora TaxID=45264 RepID=UPI001CF34BFD|nr:clustered mitochondria protein homolog [Acropora millepora]
MPAVTLEDSNTTENGEKLQCPHVLEKNGEDPQIEESTEMKIKENATQSKETESKESDGDKSQLGNVTLQFLIPGTSEPVSALFSPQDNVQDMRQVVLDRPESCYKTCFSLQLDGMRLDDFAELHMIEGLKDGVTIKVVEEPYSVREARIHLRRIKDLLSTNFQVNAYSAVDHLSLSFLSAVAGVDVEEEVVRIKGQTIGTVSTEECVPPAQVFVSEENQTLLEPLFPPNAEAKVPQCVKDLFPSAWNPPPGPRRLAGDLLYLDVITLEDVHAIITASTSGFFVNRTRDGIFNPRPHNDPCRSHTLVGLLNQLSPLFRKNFSQLQKSSIKRHPLEVIPTPYQVFPWAVPSEEHTPDTLRAEDAAAVRIGYEEHMPGQLRDWNEELQSARELPRDTLQQRLLRDRAIFKITSDFVAAATRGATAVVDGNVMAINPGEDEKKRMFIWNNIFFSFAFDSRDHFQELGGDEAAYSAAGGDLQGVTAYNRLDTQGLYTLSTVIVDYRGYRVIAQSIIPGILQREQEQSVVYGSADSGKTISSHEKFLELLNKAGKAIRVRPHKVLASNGDEIELCSSVECKGIIGADGRHYILDLFRTFPPDANFVGEKLKKISDSSEEEEAKSVLQQPYKHKLCCLRPELIEGFIAFRYVLFLKLVAMHVSAAKQREMQNKNEEKPSNEENGQTFGECPYKKIMNNDSKEGLEGNKLEEVVKQAEDNHKNSEPPTEKNTGGSDISAEAIKLSAKAAGSISDSEFDVRFNPDVYAPGIKHASSEEAALSSDKVLVQDAADFLVETVIIKIVEDFISLSQTPLDGSQLTDIMHNRGINMRYLGKLATLLSMREDLEHVYKISVMEMIVRTAKQVFKIHLQSATLRTLSVAISHFLNCFLSLYPNPQPQLPPEEIMSRKKKSKRKPQKSLTNGASTVPWAALTPEELWKSIAEETQKNFGFELKCVNSEEAVLKYRIQRLSLLRAFCIKTGVQVLLREYDFKNRKRPTFTEDDIMNLFPIVKHTNPKAFDAAAVFEAAQGRLQAGLLGEAHELMVEALNLFHSVYGPLHADIATCYRAIARLHYLAEDSVQAVSFQRKAVVVCERIFGVDHPDTVIAYVHLALYCHNAGLASVALKLMYRARYLALVVFGEGHPDMATFDSNIGLILHGQREFKISEMFLEKALDVQLKYHGSESVHTAMSFHLVARAKACISDYRAALNAEKTAFAIYSSKFGESDSRTRESSEYLKHCTQQAVIMQKKLNEICGKGTTKAAENRKPAGHMSAAVLPQDKENISHLMGYLTGLQGVHPASTSSIKDIASEVKKTPEDEAQALVKGQESEVLEEMD